MAQKLDPKHKEMYERVMNTPTKKPAGQTPSGDSVGTSTPPGRSLSGAATEPEPKPNPKPETPAGQNPQGGAQKSAFLSSMPIQPSKTLGVKTFTFSGGKKKVSREEHKEEKAKAAATPHESKTKGEKKKASPLLIAIVIIGFVALWGLFWAFILGFI